MIRKIALNEIQTDTLFTHYSNTSWNLIPVNDKKEKRVYVLTGPKETGVVIFGNDYLMTFDKKNRLKKKRKLHNNIITIGYDENSIDATGIHSHNEKTGDFILPTDICTLMLYSKYAGWDSHVIISKNNVSMWNCKKNHLIILTRKAWERIYDHQEEKQRSQEN